MLKKSLSSLSHHWIVSLSYLFYNVKQYKYVHVMMRINKVSCLSGKMISSKWFRTDVQQNVISQGFFLSAWRLGIVSSFAAYIAAVRLKVLIAVVWGLMCPIINLCSSFLQPCKRDWKHKCVQQSKILMGKNGIVSNIEILLQCVSRAQVVRYL